MNDELKIQKKEIKRLQKLVDKQTKIIEKLTGEVKYFNHLIENSNISRKGY